MKFLEMEYEVFKDVFGPKNWRLRSVVFKHNCWKVLTKEGSKPLRTLYGNAWDANDESVKLYDAGKYAESLPKCEAAVRLMDRAGKAIGIPSDENIDLAALLMRLGKCQREFGQYAAAEQTLRDALAIYVKTYGDDHPVYGDAVLELAANHQRRGETAQAEMAYRDAIVCYEKAFDYPHRDVVTALIDLGRVYNDEKKFGVAETTYLRAIKLGKEVDSPYKANRLDGLIGLATVYRNTNRLDEAEKNCREALEYARAQFTETSQNFVNASQELCLTLHEQKKYADALVISEKALLLQIEVAGGRHPYAGIVGAQTGKLRRLNGKYAEAEELAAVVASGNASRNYGDRHDRVIANLSLLSELFVDVRDKAIKESNLETARDYQKKLHDTGAELLSDAHWSVVYNRLLLSYYEELLKKPEAERKPLFEADQQALVAEDLRQQGKFKEALPVAEKVLAGLADLPQGSLKLAEAHARLGVILTALATCQGGTPRPPGR